MIGQAEGHLTHSAAAQEKEYSFIASKVIQSLDKSYKKRKHLMCGHMTMNELRLFLLPFAVVMMATVMVTIINQQRADLLALTHL